MFTSNFKSNSFPGNCSCLLPLWCQPWPRWGGSGVAFIIFGLPLGQVTLHFLKFGSSLLPGRKGGWGGPLGVGPGPGGVGQVCPITFSGSHWAK